MSTVLKNELFNIGVMRILAGHKAPESPVGLEDYILVDQRKPVKLEPKAKIAANAEYSTAIHDYLDNR